MHAADRLLFPAENWFYNLAVIKLDRLYFYFTLLLLHERNIYRDIIRPHRKPAWNNACVVFRRVSEVTGGPNPLKGRQRACDSSGVAGVHGRRWSLTIRRSVCSFAFLLHTKKQKRYYTKYLKISYLRNVIYGKINKTVIKIQWLVNELRSKTCSSHLPHNACVELVSYRLPECNLMEWIAQKSLNKADWKEGKKILRLLYYSKSIVCDFLYLFLVVLDYAECAGLYLMRHWGRP